MTLAQPFLVDRCVCLWGGALIYPRIESGSTHRRSDHTPPFSTMFTRLGKSALCFAMLIRQQGNGGKANCA